MYKDRLTIHVKIYLKENLMDKIKSILIQMGISEESTNEFIAVCESWRNEEKEKLHQEYKARIDKAKKVCMEEVEAHKSSLSRGVQVFLENKIEQIGKAAEKHAAIAESEAVMTLKKVHNLLNGLNIDSAANAQTLQAESKKNAVLTAEIATIKESLEREKIKGAKMAELAEKSIARQKALESEVTVSKKLLGEAKESLRNNRQGKPTTISEHKIKSAKPKTTTPVIQTAKIQESGDLSDIDVIAESM